MAYAGYRIVQIDDDHLSHYGIKGQQWGIRRFQNEDGTLTEEGKARYFDRMTDQQRKMYSRLPEERQRLLSRKLGQGKSWAQATDEMNRELKRNAMISTGIAVASIIYMMSPKVNRVVNMAAKSLVLKIKNSGAVKLGAQYLDRMTRRSAAKKSGAVTLGKNAYKVFHSEILG